MEDMTRQHVAMLWVLAFGERKCFVVCRLLGTAKMGPMTVKVEVASGGGMWPVKEVPDVCGVNWSTGKQAC